MNNKQIFEKIKQCILDTLDDVDADKISIKSRIIDDLGADSLDLLDLFFRIEQTFSIKLSPREIEKQIRERLKGVEFEKDGYITKEALSELKKVLPEIPHENLKEGLRQADLLALFTVEVMVNLVNKKLGGQDASKK
jgi:acyl carrier protein